jgi:hypothetical protein
MKKRILLLATVAALMALMLVAMASAALAVPPESGETGCRGGQINAAHAVDGPTGSPSWGATADNPAGENGHVSNPSRAGEAPGTQDNPGIENHASINTNDTTNCDRA